MKTTISLFATLTLLLSLPSMAWADKVYMRDGEVLTGKVIDQGNAIYLHKELGGATISKDRIDRVVYDKKVDPNDPRAKQDIVIQTSGKMIFGRVKMSPDGETVWIYIDPKLTTQDEDIVIKKDSTRVRGRVEMKKGKDGKKEIWVHKDGKITVIHESKVRKIIMRETEKQAPKRSFKGKNRISIPKDHVRKIIRRGERTLDPSKNPNKSLIAQRVQKQIERLRSDDKKVQASAKKELIKLDVFGIALIKEIAAQKPEDPKVQPVLREILRQHELRTLVSNEVENRVPKVYERLSSNDAAIRESVLQDVSLEAPKSAPKLLYYFLRNDPQPSVRAICVSQLSMLRAFPELAKILKQPNGRMKMAAAIALGEHGILAGVPVLIDALAMPDQNHLAVLKDAKASKDAKAEARISLMRVRQLKTLAYMKLKEFTGYNFGFSLLAKKEAQDQAIKDWRSWWERNGPRLMLQSNKLVEGGQENSLERKEAEKYWKEGNRLLTEYENYQKDGQRLEGLERRSRFRQVADFYRKAIQTDPTFVRARVSLAYVYYNELGQLTEAKNLLRNVLNQTINVKSKLPRKQAYFHLSAIARREGDFREAELRLYDAIKLEPKDLNQHLALGDLYMDWALVRNPLPTESTTLDAGSRGSKSETSSKKIGDRQKQRMKVVKGRFLKAQAAFKRGLRELFAQQQSLDDEAKKLIDARSVDYKKSALLRSLKSSIKALSLRSAAFYFGLGRAEAGLLFVRSAQKNFALATKMDPNNKRYKAASEYWAQVVKDRDAKIAAERAKRIAAAQKKKAAKGKK